MKDVPINEDVSTEALLGQAADEFSQRIAHGEQPDIEEYAARYPQIAALIRELFPALQEIPAVEGPDVLAGMEVPAGQLLGDYRLVREIGRGGMGVVYEAEQLSLGRRVALKILSFAAVLDSRQLQRFKNEAQAAAQLHHTNIVPVYSVGSERGVHYYAMQYIEGQPLSAVIRALREARGLDMLDARPPEGNSHLQDAVPAAQAPIRADASSAAVSLTGTVSATGLFRTMTGEASSQGAFFRSVATLAVEAADALQYAHERGVVHRDIKPSNLLIDTEGRLWLTDFGLAMVQTSPGLTMTGDLLGTVRYMSPEQTLARGAPVDHRTDIYSLGITVYELLTLRPAFTGSDRQSVLLQINMEEPRPLRQISRAIPRELETIVGKCVARSPEDRYVTARELAEDLRRFLEDKPILARPPTLLDRVSKWSRRHRTVVAAGFVLLALSLVGLSIGTFMIAGERADAMRERDAAREQKLLAERNLKTAREVLDRMLTDGALGASTDAASTERLRLVQQQESLVVSKALAEKSREPSARRELGAAYMRLGHAYGQLGQAVSAGEAYAGAAGVFEELLKSNPGEPDDAFGLAQADLCLANLQWEKRGYREAETLGLQARALLAGIVTQVPGSRPYRQQLAASLDLLGRVLRDTARPGEAESALRESLRLRRILVHDSLQGAERRQQHFERARTERNLADLLMKAGRREEAENASRDAVKTLEDLTNWFPDVQLYALELARTRKWWHEVVRLADQQPVARVQAAQFRVLPVDPEAANDGPPGYRQMLIDTHRVLSDAVNGTGDAAAADAAYDRAVSAVEAMVRQSPDIPRYREDLFNLYRSHAARMRELWRMDESEAAFTGAIAVLEQLRAVSPGEGRYQELLADMQTKRESVRVRRPIREMMQLSKGSVEDVARAIEMAHGFDLATMAPNAQLLTICADHLALGRDYERAEAYARRATEIDPRHDAAWKSLGWALMGLGRNEEARATLQQSLALVNARTGEEAVGSCPEPSTAAYMLGIVDQDRFVNRWQGVLLFGSRFEPWPWFFVGVRMEIEGRLAEAEAAYRTCEGLAVLPKAHYTARWAAYRLQTLPGAEALPPVGTVAK